MGLIILVVASTGNDGGPVPAGSTNGSNLNGIVSFAFFFIVIVQLIGILLGDKTPIMVIFWIGANPKILYWSQEEQSYDLFSFIGLAPGGKPKILVLNSLKGNNTLAQYRLNYGIFMI